MKIAVDTNTLLDFYRSRKDSLATLDDLCRYGDQLIFPEQVHREFHRNRAGRIAEYRKTCELPKIPALPSSFGDASEFAETTEARQSYEASLRKLEQLVSAWEKDPNTDPVAQRVERLYRSAHRVDTTSDLVERASQRRLRGDPPESQGKTSVGDQIIWEALLSVVRDDVVLVTRDGDFTNAAGFLVWEFKEATGCKLEIVPSIAEGQRRLGRPVEEIDRADEVAREQEKHPAATLFPWLPTDDGSDVVIMQRRRQLDYQRRLAADANAAVEPLGPITTQPGTTPGRADDRGS